MKKLSVLFFLLSPIFSYADVRISGRSIPDNLGNHIATMTVSAPFGISASTLSVSSNSNLGVFSASSGTIATELNISSTVVFSEGAGMATPTTGRVVSYAKTDGRIYSKDDTGQEDLMSGAQLYGGTFTRDMSLASGNQSITGVGFKPKAVFGITVGTTGGRDQASLGGAMTGSANYCMEIGGSTGIVYPQPTVAGIWRTAAASGNYQTFVLSSFDSDGFTIAWTKVGTPTGTANVTFFAIR